MNYLDPNDPQDRYVILNYLIEEELETLDLEEILVILHNLNNQSDSLSTTSDVRSEEELNHLLTNFHFTQQIIFDYYDIVES